MFFILTFFFFNSHIHFGQTLANNHHQIPFIQETLATESVQTDPDDPAIWIHPNQPELSVLIGTDKAYDIGGLYMFDLNGKILQHIENIDRPNNVDVEYNFKINETYSIDLIVLTERGQKRLRIFTIHINTRQLYDLTGLNTQVFIDSIDDEAAPMGIGLYKRMNDEKIYAIVSRKSGPQQGYLGQYELIWNDEKIDLKFIRYFGDFHGAEIESIVVDDQLGFVYYSDEDYGIRKYNIESTSHIEQAGFINTTNIWHGDSEGLALYTKSNRTGYLIITEQLKNGSIFHIYERQGQNSYIKSIQTHAVSTDGIEVTSRSLNKQFPDGLLIVMNEIDKNFLLYDWNNIEKEFDFIQNNVYYNQLNFNCFFLELCIIWIWFFTFS